MPSLLTTSSVLWGAPVPLLRNSHLLLHEISIWSPSENHRAQEVMNAASERSRQLSFKLFAPSSTPASLRIISKRHDLWRSSQRFDIRCGENKVMQDRWPMSQPDVSRGDYWNWNWSRTEHFKTFLLLMKQQQHQKRNAERAPEQSRI